jgi:hypothetical protein
MADTRIKSRFVCSPKKSNEGCRLEFLDEHPEFIYVPILGDGNCFFRALAAYYERTGEQIDGVADPTDHKELRRYIVNRFGQQIQNEWELREIVLPALNDRPIPTILSELAQTCSWNVPVFEMMVERTPSMLNINLRLFRINHEGKRLTVTEAFHTPNDGPAVPTTISIFLGGNHYGLLYPVDAPNASNYSSNSVSNANNLYNAELNWAMKNSALIAKLAALELSKPAAAAASPSKKPPVGSLSVKNISSPKTRKKPSVGILPINSSPNTRKKPSVGSLPHSFNNNSNIEPITNAEFEKEFPISKQTKDAMTTWLKKRDISVPSKINKPELYELFKWFMKPHINNTTRQKKKEKRNASRRQ